MRKQIYFNFLTTLLFVIISIQGEAQNVPDNMKDKASYGLGMSIAQNLIKDGLTDLNFDQLVDGLKDHVAGNATMSIQDSQAALDQYFEEKQALAATENLLAGTEFLIKNMTENPNVVQLPSGLQYEIMVEGTGEKPTLTSKVTTHYHGSLTNGKVFDSSVERGQPASFPVNGVIAGWTEALQLMPVGSKWKLFIPANLAYGSKGAQGAIGPNETLIFEVELISID